MAKNKEPGQSFDEYRKSGPVRPIGRRNTIFIQPLGKMTAKHREIVQQTAEYMRIYFDTPVIVRKRMSLEKMPSFAEREARGFGKQLLTAWVMRDVLGFNLRKAAERLAKMKKADIPDPTKPDFVPDLNNAAAFLAFTARDLWTGEKDSNFVFGQALLPERVAVWSMARNGDPEKDYTRCLRRAIKTATHETSHMFSMRHCIKWECNMCGSMTRRESDRHPLALCPECVAKICWACTAKPRQRYVDLIALCKKFGLDKEREFFVKSLAVLGPEKSQ